MTTVLAQTADAATAHGDDWLVISRGAGRRGGAAWTPGGFSAGGPGVSVVFWAEK
jgi:hypothetical protein